MSVSYTIEKGYARCKAAGAYTFEETYHNYQTALDDPRFLQGYNLLMDVYDSHETRTYDEMNKIAECLAAHPKFGRKCALLIKPDSRVRFGHAQMLSMISGHKGVDFSIFFNLDDARKFLGY